VTALSESGSYVGEIIKLMGKDKVLVKVNHDGKYVVKVAKNIKISDCKPSARVALKSDSYMIHRILSNSVDPLVSLMKVEKVPDANYDMIGGCDK